MLKMYKEDFKIVLILNWIKTVLCSAGALFSAGVIAFGVVIIFIRDESGKAEASLIMMGCFMVFMGIIFLYFLANALHRIWAEWHHYDKVAMRHAEPRPVAARDE